MLNLSRETVTSIFQALQTNLVVKWGAPSKLLVLNYVN